MFGMLVVETISKIRRAFFHQKKAIRTISRELKSSRKVIRKVIRSGATEFRYERSIQPMPKIGPWRDQLDGLLLSNEGKSRRERLTLIHARARRWCSTRMTAPSGFFAARARGVFTTMKTAVDTVFLGKDRRFNRRFLQMCGHYLVEPTACTPAAGWEKG